MKSRWLGEEVGLVVVAACNAKTSVRKQYKLSLQSLNPFSSTTYKFLLALHTFRLHTYQKFYHNTQTQKTFLLSA